MLQDYEQEGKKELKYLQPQVWYDRTLLVGDPHTHPERKIKMFPRSQLSDQENNFFPWLIQIRSAVSHEV